MSIKLFKTGYTVTELVPGGRLYHIAGAVTEYACFAVCVVVLVVPILMGDRMTDQELTKLLQQWFGISIID